MVSTKPAIVFTTRLKWSLNNDKFTKMRGLGIGNKKRVFWFSVTRPYQRSDCRYLMRFWHIHFSTCKETWHLKITINSILEIYNLIRHSLIYAYLDGAMKRFKRQNNIFHYSCVHCEFFHPGLTFQGTWVPHSDACRILFLLALQYMADAGPLKILYPHLPGF